MPDWAKQSIENIISEVLISDAQKNALEFVTYLRASEMLFERGKGYWNDKYYWMIKYKDEYVCFILINGSENNEEPWIIWSDDSNSDWFADFPMDEHMKEIAWYNVDICANCGGDYSPGTYKTIFGKEFNNVCRTTMRFINPDVEELEFLKKMVEIRKNDIILS